MNGAEAMLRLDGNVQWSLPTAIRVFREIESYDIRNYEDPVATVRVPDGPGLGVTLDREALARRHAHFVANGPLDHFHDPAAPGRFRRLPLAWREARAVDSPVRATGSLRRS